MIYIWRDHSTCQHTDQREALSCLLEEGLKLLVKTLGQDNVLDYLQEYNGRGMDPLFEGGSWRRCEYMLASCEVGSDYDGSIQLCLFQGYHLSTDHYIVERTPWSNHQAMGLCGLF